MKKKLDVGNITNELKGASLFFTKSASPSPLPEPEKVIVEEKPSPLPDSPVSAVAPIQKTEPKINKRKVQENKLTNNRDTTVSRYHDTTVSRVDGAIVEVVRKAVREVGKEAATHRFTQAEKKEIGDIIYTYKNQGVKTSENEVARIAVNFIIEDYKENGENSVLHKILEALNE